MSNMMFGSNLSVNSAPTFTTNDNYNIKVRRFLIIETGTYNPQYGRPYMAQISGQHVDELNERVANTGNYGAAVISAVAGSIIIPAANVERNIIIPNGWDTRRMRFIMHIDCVHPMGEVIAQVITGYTDYNGISGSHLDPNMNFIIDTDITGKHVREGNSEYMRVINSSNIIADNDFNGIGYHGAQLMQRPSDIFSTVSNSHLQDADGNMPLVNTGIVTQQAVKSRSSNNNPVSFLADILTSYSQSQLESQDHGDGTQEILHKARQKTMESSMVRDRFMSALTKARGGISTNMFTMRDILAIDPNAAHVTHVSQLSQTDRMATHNAGQTAYWHAADLETQIATTLSNSIPSVMAELGIVRAAFTSTNRTFGTQLVTVVTNVDSFNGADTTIPGRIFQNKLEAEVLRNVSHNGEIDFEIQMQLDLTGETLIRISIHGGPAIDYCTPSFCSSILSPVITTNRDIIKNSAEQLGGLFQYVGLSNDIVTGSIIGGTGINPSFGSVGQVTGGNGFTNINGISPNI